VITGNFEQVGKQLLAVLAVIAFSAAMTFIILKLINLFVGLRVADQEEVLGLDTSQHGEPAYQL